MSDSFTLLPSGGVADAPPSPPETADVHPSGNGANARAGRVAGESIADEYAGMDFTDDEDGLDPERDAPVPLTAAMLNKFLADNPQMHPVRTMRLHQASIQYGQPFSAEVRIVNLTDKTLIGTLPFEVRRIVEKLFFGGQGSGNPRKQKSGQQRLDEGLQRVKEVGYAYGCAGFVNPRLVLRPEDVKDPEKEAWVGTIPLHDLTEFSRICEGDDKLAARRLEPFPVEPDSAV
jgi:hypothetical protein